MTITCTCPSAPIFALNVASGRPTPVECRDSRQRVSGRRARLGWLPALADTDRLGHACCRQGNGRMSTGSAERPAAKPRGPAHRVRVIVSWVVAALAGLFFVVAVVLMASAPWVLLQPDQDVRTELNRWFLTVAGSVDAITAGVLLALAQQPRLDTPGRRTSGRGDCGRCDHPSLPALVRCHPCDRRGPAARLPVLG